MQHEYPRTIRRLITVIWVGVLALNISEYFLEWVRAVYALLYKPLQLPYIEFLQPFHAILPTMITAHIGLLLALIVARALAFLTPRITIQSTGLLMSTALGKRWIPFTALRSIRSTELQTNNRYVVWVDATTGLPLQGWIASMLFGRWLWRGFLLTSDLAGFDDVIAAIVASLKQKYGEEKFPAHLIEAQPTWLLAMLNAPRETIRELVAADQMPITQPEATRQMVSLSAWLAIPALVAALIQLQFPWLALVIPLLALIEFPLAALFLSVIPIGELRRIEFTDAMRVYPLTQLPRWWIALGLTLLVIAGVPPTVLLFIPIPAILLSSFTVIKLTAEWFQVSAPESWLGALATVIYQLVLYELLVVFLPR